MHSLPWVLISYLSLIDPSSSETHVFETVCDGVAHWAPYLLPTCGMQFFIPQ